MLRDAISLIAVFAVTVTAITVPYIVRPGVTLDFSEDAPAGLPYARGFYAPERDPDGLTMAWASSDARLTLAALPRATEWTLYMRGRAARRAAAAPVKLLDGERQVAVWNAAPPTSRSFAEIFVNLPPSPASGLSLQIVSRDSVVPGPDDPRELALLVDHVTLKPVGRLIALPWRRVLLASSGMVMVCLLLLPFRRRRDVFAGAALSAVVLGWLLHKSSMLYLPAFSNVLWGITPVVGVIAVGLLFRRLMAVAATADAAFAITSWFTYVKYLLLTHPAMVLGDAVFHQNRARIVAAGEYLFTSAAPGGEFPYPVAFYVVANLLSGDSPPSVNFMRGFVLSCDSVAGLLVAFSLAGAAAHAAPPLASAFWQTTPVLYQVQGVAYLTNSFGNSMSVLSLVCFHWALRQRRALGWVAAATVCATTALLAHVSSFVILAATLFCVGGIAAMARRGRAACLCLVVLSCSLGAAWIIYYRHFTPLYAQRAAAVGDPRPPTMGPLPLQRLEAHQTMYVPGWPALKQRLAIVPFYVQKYLGFALLALAASAVWTRRQGIVDSRDTVILAAGWLLAILGCFLLGQFTAVDVRYYLGAAPLVAALAAIAAATIWAMPARQNRVKRATVAALSVAAVLQGCHYMARFLSFPLPR